MVAGVGSLTTAHLATIFQSKRSSNARKHEIMSGCHLNQVCGLRALSSDL